MNNRIWLKDELAKEPKGPDLARLRVQAEQEIDICCGCNECGRRLVWFMWDGLSRLPRPRPGAHFVQKPDQLKLDVYCGPCFDRLIQSQRGCDFPGDLTYECD